MTEVIYPHYAPEPNASIELRSANIELRTQSGTLRGRATVNWDLSKDKVGITADFPAHPDSLDEVDGKAPVVRLEPSSSDCEVLISSSSHDGTSLLVNMLPNRAALVMCEDRRVRLSSLTAHVLNFPNFVCLTANSTDIWHKRADSGRRLGRAVLAHDGWTIEFQAVPDITDAIAELKKSGGNAVTHVLRIQRTDGKRFTIRSAERVMNDIYEFLSFARGSWTSVFGWVGFSTANTVAYENWGMRLATSWESSSGWFDIHHGEVLTDVYSGFVALRHNPTFGKAARTALYWYLRSNRAGNGAGIDGGLILSVAALEGLATTYLSAAGINLGKKPSTADKVRAACNHLKIPTAIPSPSKRLRGGRRSGAWKDGPEAIARIRNELVHPTPKLKVKVGPTISEAWKLSQWYIEMLLLQLAGYNGRYSNRLIARWVGETEPVPWAPRR